MIIKKRTEIVTSSERVGWLVFGYSDSKYVIYINLHLMTLLYYTVNCHEKKKRKEKDRERKSCKCSLRASVDLGHVSALWKEERKAPAALS